MAQDSMASSPPKRFGVGRIVWWFFALGSFALLLFLLASEVMRFSTPAQLHRLQIVQDIPLPDALPDPHRTSQNPFAPGQAQRFDHFDFQSFDPHTHLLFIVHTGPNPDKEAAILHNPKFDEGTDGNIVVFNTQLRKVVGLIDVPQSAGILVAPDLGKVFIGDVSNGIIYIANEQSPFHIIAKVQLDPLDGPDALEYDPVDHRIFVGDPGSPADPDNANVALKNQNVAVIDAITNKLITKIPFGLHPPFGDDVGHIQFDPVTHRIFVVTLPLIDQNSNSVQTPPSFLAVVDPVTLKIVSKIRLPDACLAPHGIVIDAQQREAFVACVDSNTLARVDLQTMQAFPGTLLSVAYNPDIVRLDRSLHLIFVGCAGGISIFDESGRSLKKLGDYFLGGGSHHTLAIDEATQLIYLPQPSIGERPVLRVIKYVANGV
ncbi:MAG: YncE family protein [Chloroflexi bacterium]|nr:MAG: YncE family protein [Chloroflexota bacterium]